MSGGCCRASPGKAGINRRVHAHGLRHTYASELAREGTAINAIRAGLGVYIEQHAPAGV